MRTVLTTRKGVSTVVAGLLLVGGVVIGAIGLYVATTYQTKVVTTIETTTQTNVSTLTTTGTLTNIQVSVSETTQTETQTVTKLSPTTTTETSTVISTSITTFYPIPDNVTVYLVASSMFMNYAINAGTYSNSGSLGGSQSFMITPVYQGETISISIGNPCAGSTGPTGDAYLYVNGSLAAHAGIACGGNNSAQISYVL